MIDEIKRRQCTKIPRYALPCVISLLVAALYNIVDQIFIANASYLGSYGNAANTVVFPLTVVALAIAVLIGDGCCALVSICLGAGKHRRAGSSVGNAVALSLAAGLVLTALYLLFQDPILTLLCSADGSMRKPSVIPGNISFTSPLASPSICLVRP